MKIYILISRLDSSVPSENIIAVSLDLENLKRRGELFREGYSYTLADFPWEFRWGKEYGSLGGYNWILNVSEDGDPFKPTDEMIMEALVL